ncbi:MULTISPECIES: ROK family transcriptional regulator [unclassified Mesorhizobium]|uniref:ROK family transcriptional regulator n=2 Tax=Mesorhizobium TaxID=68287 RepID=UPI000FCBF612|nr:MULTISPECIES: ROK family transcriptional regulator [unclassified Mesorhizobium]RUW23732.1 ROK family transcriptional regulator [Mesorhizobium sp. M4B.F.Ca.ET.013.02.1.1]RUW76577.1 ROK family transcriptional regulator [Mesorhizobium sp. M4B.F.Ca.ET.049.02.1.2]RVD21280.1 ROK family transcriptional regulator [Mesorhizobium sp. M4B.F.Ca.ET.017.02.2.1]RWF64443.1 MAG: ROK family transcriptional regulator [Mesorhizobium sp.]TGQ11263.1 ROK family transcriptional regulator [Mesorhizobium sp. M4B.F.C
MKLKGDQQTSRAMNRRLILNMIRADGPMSRADMATRSGLSPAAVTFVVSELLDENILVEGEASLGAPGRRPIPISINYAGRLVVGLKLKAGAIDCVLTDLATTPLVSRQVAVPDPSPQSTVEACAAAVKELLADRKAPSGAQLSGIGIAVPGVIDNGVCRLSHRFNWIDVPIAAMLAELVHVPVWADDDTNAFALAQQLFGLGRHHRTVGALAIGAGISCAVVIDGAVHHGASGAAGKMGHSIYNPNGPQCECGRRGCLQTFFSEPALVRRWREAKGLPGEASRHDMFEAAQAGDETAVEILREAGEGIGRFLGGFCNIIDPEVIVGGGEAVSFGDYLFEPMRDALKRYAMWNPPPITPDWADDSWARGAAALATQRLFDFESRPGETRAVM